jgi:acetyl esterase/lipase
LNDLGSALFLIGTEDALVDDLVLMQFRWQRAGNEAVVKFVPGAPHGFMTFDGREVECTREGWGILIKYLRERLSE